ncbi:MAG: type II secretion system GspH family protein [Candidatus Omnitrophica bacterium]|nr:type II secretion system GspH family protein [Candidatus Omnitrophota bacterium]
MILKIGNKNSFTLIEMMVSGVLLSLVFVFVLQGLFVAMRGMDFIRALNEAIFFAEDKIQELQVKIDKKLSFSQTERLNHKDILLEYQIFDEEKSTLKKLLLDLSFRNKRLFNLSTYLKFSLR